MVLFSCKNENKIQQKPNIIFILADDLGYGELGSYGQTKIETPHLDKLAEEGIRFTQHYTGAPVCAPARCVFLTGKHSGHASIRGNDEWRQRGNVWSYNEMINDSTLEGQRPLPENTQTLAATLKEDGYKTAMFGKWGLGAPHTHSIPTKMGFDYFMGYNCQRQAHTYFPVHLYENESRIYLQNDTVAPHTKLGDKDPNNSSSYSQFNLNTYAPDLMFEALSQFVGKNKTEPFFIYWATPIPHLPLQAPDSLVNYYRNKFGEELAYNGDHGYFPNQYPRATYAAMITYLDQRIGQLIQQLKEEGIYDNTLIIFTSDNGPSYAGGVDFEFFNSAGPFKNEYGYTKGFVHEGGIRVPLIVSWPNQINEGRESDLISSFIDFYPTFNEIAGIDSENLDGISILPEIIGKAQQEVHDYLYWEFPEYNGQQAIRMDNWKAIRKNIRDGNLEIELYNLNTDIREETNLAEQYPELIIKMDSIMKLSHMKSENPRFHLKAIGD